MKLFLADSLAMDLHPDAIVLAHESEPIEENNKVRFEPFVGIGPRHFLDLFSMTLGSGRKIKRKQNGQLVQWGRGSAVIRVPLLPMSYMERETYVTWEIDELTGGNDGNNKEQ